MVELRDYEEKKIAQWRLMLQSKYNIHMYVWLGEYELIE